MDEPNYTVGALLTGRDIIGVLVIGPNMMESSEIVKVYHQISVGMQHLELIRNEQELIAVLDRNNLRLSRESECDELTGIFNRRGFLNNIEHHINGVLNGSETERSAAIFYMDLDGLKQINDTYGHDEGDFIIKSTADMLNKAFEKGFVGRLGGDEFLGCCIPDGTEFFEPDELISSVEKMMDDFNLTSGKPYKLKISIGYRKFPVDSETMKKLPSYMEDADKMLYDNKRKHKEL
jgi:diguanylate cyclase (GGDEF)-like protein